MCLALVANGEARYQINDDEDDPPDFAASADNPNVQGSTWETTRQLPRVALRYEWRITRLRIVADGVATNWSDWAADDDPIREYGVTIEYEYRYQLSTDGDMPPDFLAAQDNPSTQGSVWSTSGRLTTASKPFEWRITRERTVTSGIAGDWSDWELSLIHI